LATRRILIPLFQVRVLVPQPAIKNQQKQTISRTRRSDEAGHSCGWGLSRIGNLGFWPIAGVFLGAPPEIHCSASISPTRRGRRGRRQAIQDSLTARADTVPITKMSQVRSRAMIAGKSHAFVKPTPLSAKRFFIRKFSETPRELLGTKMEKERYLNALAEKTLSVVGVHPQQTQ
jgi:hypothetical protein